jgi:kynurenine formamidase
MTAGGAPQVDYSAATSLALELDFDQIHPRHFGAPSASSTPFRVGSFEGEVVLGASCNCRSITLIPHCNGTHTESVSHLTLQQYPLHRMVPFAPIRALLLTVKPRLADEAGDDSVPPPQRGDHLLTRADLLEAWQPHSGFAAQALLLRTATQLQSTTNPPYLSRQFMRELVTQGIEHLVVDLPSVDRSEDEGRLTAHRIFFGLPPDSTDRNLATRAHCTITELAHFPASLRDGPCALQLQIPAFTGDAVPSRPVHLPLISP